MTREIAQYVYNLSGIENTINYQQLLGRAEAQSPLCNKSIIQLGIQAWSGLRFFLNGDIEHGVVIGQSNIYERNVDGMTIITSVTFDKESLRDEPGPIIIDIVYEAEEGIQ